jgi:hypothetical protein
MFDTYTTTNSIVTVLQWERGADYLNVFELKKEFENRLAVVLLILLVNRKNNENNSAHRQPY